MNRDSVIKMAELSGFVSDDDWLIYGNIHTIERFANLVWNHALEEASKEADNTGKDMENNQPNRDFDMACGYCARNIRAMKVGAGKTAT